MHRHSLYLLLTAFVLSACGAAEPPRAAQPTAAPASVPATYPPPTITSTPLSSYPDPANLPPALALAEQIQTQATTTAAQIQAHATATAVQWTPTPEPISTPAPSELKLRDVWPTAPAGTPRSVQLLYNMDGNKYDGSYTFWQLDLSSMQSQPIMTVQGFPTGQVVGQLAPDGQTIAYQQGGHATYELHIIQPDGLNDRVLAHNLGLQDIPCKNIFAWSPDGQQLVFRQRWKQAQTGEDHLLVTDIHMTNAPHIVAHALSLDTIGWLDTSHLLILNAPIDRNIFQIERINTISQDRELLTEFPREQDINCMLLTPDRQAILFGVQQGILKFDLASRKFATIGNLPLRHIIWGTDQDTMLVFGEQTNGTLQITHLNQPNQQTRVVLTPPHQSSRSFDIISASPDGAYLVGCNIEHLDQNSTGSRFHTWLYTIRQDQWTLLGDAREQCANVLGWKAER